MSKMTDENRTWLLSYVSGQNFYNKKLKDSKDTYDMYLRGLKRYCDDVQKNPDELIALKLTGMQHPATELEFAAENLLEKFLSNDKLTASTKLSILTAVKTFYKCTRGRELTSDTGENIQKPEAKKRTPSLQDCLDLENAMTTARDKFLIWFLESSPVRQGTLRKLLWKDLKPTDDKDVPYSLKIEGLRLKGHNIGKYQGTRHIGFIHSYAAEKLENYKAELAKKKIEYNENSPLFMSYNSNKWGAKKGSALKQYNGIFNNASLAAWKDISKKKYSPHDFRDIITTILEKPTIKANINLAKPLTSHKPSGIESIYANHPDSDYLELYKMCLPYLLPRTIPELEIKVNEQKQENEKQQSSINNMEAAHKRDMEEMKAEQNKKLENIENKFDSILAEYSRLKTGSELGINKPNAKTTSELKKKLLE